MRYEKHTIPIHLVTLQNLDESREPLQANVAMYRKGRRTTGTSPRQLQAFIDHGWVEVADYVTLRKREVPRYRITREGREELKRAREVMAMWMRGDV